MPSVDVWFPSIFLIDVASIMFAEECCYFLVIRAYADGVVFTRFRADHDEAAGGQLD